MKQVNIHEAKTHLSALIEKTVAGEPFVIAKSGIPKVIVYSYQSLQNGKSRTGFMPNINIPDNFDTLDDSSITAQFYGEN